MTTLSATMPQSDAQSVTPLFFPPAAKATDAVLWRGENREYRLGDYIVAWVDMGDRPFADSALGAVASAEWDAGVELVYAYHDAFGTFPTNDTIVNGYRLGKFVQRQRTAYRKIGVPGAKEPLALDKVPVLEAVPLWGWEARLGRPLKHGLWFEHFTMWLTHRTGSTWTETDRFLDEWESRQHSDYAEGSMPLYRRVLLAALPDHSWRTPKRPYGKETVISVEDINAAALATADVHLHGITAPQLQEQITVAQGLIRAHSRRKKALGR